MTRLFARAQMPSVMLETRRRCRHAKLPLVALGVVTAACLRTFAAIAWVRGPPQFSGQRDEARRLVIARGVPQALQARASLSLVKEQNNAGFSLKNLGWKLDQTKFEATAVDGKATVVVDGVQRLRTVNLAADAVAAAGGNDALAQALLGAMQQAHDESYEKTRGEVWELYKGKKSLLQAPLTQIGVGNTAEDLWANVTKTPETLRMAEALFERFDEDLDGYWNLNETSTVQKATEGSDMAEDAFHALIIAAAPEGGRNLSEDDLVKGLSKPQVLELYTEKERQRKLGFVLNVVKDYKAVFETPKPDPEAKSGPVTVD